MGRLIYRSLVASAILIGCGQEVANEQMGDESAEIVRQHDSANAALLGYWFQPQGALRNIAFWPDREFVFNEWEGSSLPRRGMFELEGDRLTLTFQDGDTKSLTFGKVRDGDPNLYITGDESMVRGGDLLPPEEPFAEDPPMPKRLWEFLNSRMPDLRLLPANHWLDPQYLEDYNANDLIVDKIAYPDNVFINGDFNGDRLSDYAGLFVDNSGELELLAFHSRHDPGVTFKQFTVVSLHKIERCCAGAGVTVRPPGSYQRPFEDSGALQDIATDSILLSYYEKSGQTFYFAGESYSSFFSSD